MIDLGLLRIEMCAPDIRWISVADSHLAPFRWTRFQAVDLCLHLLSLTLLTLRWGARGGSCATTMVRRHFRHANAQPLDLLHGLGADGGDQGVDGGGDLCGSRPIEGAFQSLVQFRSRRRHGVVSHAGSLPRVVRHRAREYTR